MKTSFIFSLTALGGHAIVMRPFSLILGQFRVIKAVKTAVQLNKDEEEEGRGIKIRESSDLISPRRMGSNQSGRRDHSRNGRVIPVTRRGGSACSSAKIWCRRLREHVRDYHATCTNKGGENRESQTVWILSLSRITHETSTGCQTQQQLPIRFNVSQENIRIRCPHWFYLKRKTRI